RQNVVWHELSLRSEQYRVGVVAPGEGNQQVEVGNPDIHLPTVPAREIRVQLASAIRVCERVPEITVRLAAPRRENSQRRARRLRPLAADDLPPIPLAVVQEQLSELHEVPGGEMMPSTAVGLAGRLQEQMVTVH